ncbi:MAG: hypothetical protein N2C14_30555 [Planctomycetales bacterium]
MQDRMKEVGKCAGLGALGGLLGWLGIQVVGRGVTWYLLGSAGEFDLWDSAGRFVTLVAGGGLLGFFVGLFTLLSPSTPAETTTDKTPAKDKFEDDFKGPAQQAKGSDGPRKSENDSAK